MNDTPNDGTNATSNAGKTRRLSISELFDGARANRQVARPQGADLVPKTDELEHLAERRYRAKTRDDYATASVLLIDALLVALEFAITHPVEAEPVDEGNEIDRDAENEASRFLRERNAPTNALPAILRELAADIMEDSRRTVTVGDLINIADRIEGTR